VKQLMNSKEDMLVQMILEKQEKIEKRGDNSFRLIKVRFIKILDTIKRSYTKLY
jgi:hypothetical protein